MASKLFNFFRPNYSLLEKKKWESVGENVASNAHEMQNYIKHLKHSSHNYI